MVFAARGQAKQLHIKSYCPNRFIRDQIESEYLTLIKETVAFKSSNFNNRGYADASWFPKQHQGKLE
ncbi:MAG: hypothetical protein CM15mP69_2920 [Ectothiorhodospiraceae bacterium]|nr:MAG: hypothetical protein CM15mP69_2920 [Ectothiorhodospiraceae bacterium]